MVLLFCFSLEVDSHLSLPSPSAASAGREREGNFPSPKRYFLTKLHLDPPLTLKMPYLREDSGWDGGLRVLQGFLLALPLRLNLEANWEPQPRGSSRALQPSQNGF